MPTRGTTVEFSTVLVVEICCTCFMTFAVPDDFRARRRSDKASFFCPSGHSQSYQGESDADAVRRLEREKLEIERDRNQRIVRYEQWLDQVREENKVVTKQLSSTRGQLTKARRRIANGVCPCCNRSFEQLARHMATQHPDFLADTSS